MLKTRYGSQVEIVAAYKDAAAIGVFLVQARVITQGPQAPVASEVVGQVVQQNDPFSKGWIPSSHLVADGGPQELLNAACDAEIGTPSNAAALLRLYWPTIFGFITPEDIIQGRFGATTMLDSVRNRLGTGTNG